MTNIEIDDLIELSQELWPKAKPIELKILRGMLKDCPFDKAKSILEGARVSENVQMLPLKTIKSKLDAKNPAIKPAAYNYVDCFLVCTQSDGESQWMYPGAFRELAVPNNYTEIEILDLLRRYVQYDLQPYHGLCEFEFFVGRMNLQKARLRSKEIKQKAHRDGVLPNRFYAKPKVVMSTEKPVATPPASLVSRIAERAAEFDPNVDDGIPF